MLRLSTSKGTLVLGIPVTIFNEPVPKAAKLFEFKLGPVCPS